MTISQVLLGLLSLSTLTSSQRTPTISYVSAPKLTTSIGGTVELDCSVLYAQDFPILWVKLPSKCDSERVADIRAIISDQCTPIPLSSGSALIVRDNRFSLRHDMASSTFTLQIKDVQRTDQATYQCQILVGLNNKVTRHVELLVSEPASISDSSTRSVVVTEGEPAELFCSAAGNPQPQISWRRENNAILPTGGVQYRGQRLRLHSVQKEDRGTYYCVADNKVGQPARRTVAVEVEFPPSISTPKVEIAQTLGLGVLLVCQIEAFPPATITWSHNGIQLATNERVTVHSGYTTADDLTEVSVRIRALTPDMLGKYYCRAQNKLGSDEQELNVVIADQPDCSLGQCELRGINAAVHYDHLLAIKLHLGIMSIAFLAGNLMAQ